MCLGPGAPDNKTAALNTCNMCHWRDNLGYDPESQVTRLTARHPFPGLRLLPSLGCHKPTGEYITRCIVTPTTNSGTIKFMFRCLFETLAPININILLGI